MIRELIILSVQEHVVNIGTHRLLLLGVALRYVLFLTTLIILVALGLVKHTS
jgi:hypothetical protein